MLTEILTGLGIGLIIAAGAITVGYLLATVFRWSTFHAVAATCCFAGLALGGSWWLLLAGALNVAVFALNAWQDEQDTREEADDAAEAEVAAAE